MISTQRRDREKKNSKQMVARLGDAIDNDAKGAVASAGEPIEHPVTEPPGEMAQQGVADHHGTESAPQKLVQLVGYRDPDAPDHWRRPGSTDTE